MTWYEISMSTCSLTVERLATVQAQALYTSLKEAEKDFDQVRKLPWMVVMAAAELVAGSRGRVPRVKTGTGKTAGGRV